MLDICRNIVVAIVCVVGATSISYWIVMMLMTGAKVCFREWWSALRTKIKTFKYYSTDYQREL